MRNTSLTVSLAMALFSSSALSATDYQLAPDLSSVSFATIKKQFVVEPATMSLSSGSLSENGQFQVVGDVKSVSTGVPIRDTRLSELFFNVAAYPQVTVSGSVDWKAMSSGPQKMTIPAEVTMYGTTHMMEFPVIVISAESAITVSSYSPVIVNAADFGIPAESLSKLSATVGDIPISTQVPLSVTLTFMK